MRQEHARPRDPAPDAGFSAGTVCFDGENVLEMGPKELLRLPPPRADGVSGPLRIPEPAADGGRDTIEVLRVHALCPPTEIGSAGEELMDHVGLPAELAARRARSAIRRPMPARRHRARAGSRCRAHHRRRAGLSARRLDPGANPESVDPAAARDGTDAAVHLARSRRSPPSLPARGGDVSRPHRRGGAARTSIFRNPQHPYTQALHRGDPAHGAGRRRCRPLLGRRATSPLDAPTGCPFHPRCPHAMPVCRSGDPPSFRAAGEALVACHLYPEEDLRNLTAMSTGSESAP